MTREELDPAVGSRYGDRQRSSPQSERDELRTVGGGWGRRAAGRCVEDAIRRLISDDAPDDIDIWTLQETASHVAQSDHGAQRSNAWVRRTVASFVGVYWWRFLPPRGQWRLVHAKSASPPASTPGKPANATHTADLTWQSRDGLVLVDEIKVASGLSYVSETQELRNQLNRHLARADAEYATRFVGVRFIPLALPRRAMLLDQTGAHLLSTTTYCTEGGWR